MTTLNREDMTHQFSLNCFAQVAPVFKPKYGKGITMTTLNQRPKQHEMTWGAEGDLGGYTFTPEELQQATAQYHVEQDMEAMATRIDQLEAENATLQQSLTDHKNWLRIANDQWSKADENLTNYMVKVALTP